MRWHRRLKLTQQMEIQASHLAKYERYSTLVKSVRFLMYGNRFAGRACNLLIEGSFLRGLKTFRKGEI